MDIRMMNTIYGLKNEFGCKYMNYDFIGGYFDDKIILSLNNIS